MAEVVQMFLFLYKSKYRRKEQWPDGPAVAIPSRDGVATVPTRPREQPRRLPQQRRRKQEQLRRQRCHGGGIARATTAVPWRWLLWAALVCCWVMRVSAAASASSSSPMIDATCNPNNCYGNCSSDGTCLCREGWQGARCEFCGGKVR